MKPLHLSLAVPVVATFALVLGACGGDSDDADSTVTSAVSTEATGSPAASLTAGAEPSTATPGGSPTNEDAAGETPASEGEGDATTAPATAEATAPAEEPATAPAQDPERVKAFTNGLLGSAQEPLYWMQLITGDIECGTNCPDSLDERWSRAVSVCGNGRWDARTGEDGYHEETHGPLIAALVESCGILSAKYSGGGTPDDSEEWWGAANSALNVLGPQYDALLEASLAEG